MLIETGRLIIREFCDCDLNDAHRLFCMKDEMYWLGLAPEFGSVGQSRERLDRWKTDGIHFAIDLKSDRRFIGYIAICPDPEENRDDTRELGFVLLPEFRHNGYMRECVLAVLDLLRSQGIKYVWACCAEGNRDSERLINGCGFELSGSGTVCRCYENKKYEWKTLEYRMDLGRIE